MKRPGLFLSSAAVLLLILAWGYFRLHYFGRDIVPLTFVVPLLLGVWTGRRWQVWVMAAVFAVMAVAKVWFTLPEGTFTERTETIYLWTTLFNVLVGAVVVQMILSMREDLERRNETIAAQNHELELQAEELTQQNEEITAQSEELAGQNEEIESQSEEVAAQNEELLDANERLSRREEILHNLLDASRSPGGKEETVDQLCRRTLQILGTPAAAVVFLEEREDHLAVSGKATLADHPVLPECWPLTNSLAGLVHTEKKTAYVSDLPQRPDLAAPFGPDSPVQSLLAAPIRIPHGPGAVLVACSLEAAHWSDEQFRVMEWVSAQCGLFLEAFRWQEAVALRTEELQRASQAKDRFLAMLSHELRTPLTPVLATTGVLEGDVRLPEDVRNDLRMIRRNVGIQSRLIDDLLDLTRISRGKVDLDMRSLPVADLLRDAASIVEPDLTAKRQRISLELAQLDHHHVLGDGPRLQQVFWNVLKNAVKFSPEGGQIELRAEVLPGAGRVRIEVRDHGVGLDDQDVDRIFLPFEQVIEGRQRGGEGGLGLGLAIAKAVVELHEGKIFVRSAGVSRGASFFVELPVMDGPAPEEAPSASSASGTQREGTVLRILLVEDHVDTGMVLAKVLQSSGHRVEYAQTAGAAFEIFLTQEFDLLVSDLGLPDESGLDLMRRMKKLRPDLRGICLTGYGMEDDRKACREAGFDEHLTKPVEASQLEAVIARVTAEGGEKTGA